MAPPSSSDRTRGSRSGGGGTGGAAGRQGGGKSGKGGQGGGKGGQGGGKGGQGGGKGAQGGKPGRGGPPGRGPKRPGTPGENETVQQLTGPLQRVLARLPETQRKVLELRMGLADGHPHDLADTARELGLSLSEARDIEQRAFGYIREAVPLQQLQRFLPKS
jgi:hypothetical protein